MRKYIFVFALAFVFIVFLLNHLLVAQDYIRILEETWMYYILRAMEGLPIYMNPEKLPFAFNEYSPIYYYVAAFTGNIFTNTDPENSQFLYTLLRIQNIGFCILSSFFSYLILRCYNVNKILAFTGFVMVFISFWTPSLLLRPDSLKTLFVMIGFFALLRFMKTNHLLWLMSASISLTLAVFTKQDAIMFVVLACLALLFTRNYKSFAVFSFFSLILAFSLFFFFQKINNQFFLQNLLGVVSVDFIWKWFWKSIAVKFLIKFLPLIAVSVYVCIKWIHNKNIKQDIQLLSIFTLGSLLFSTLFSIRYGSEPLYFTEFQFFSIFCIIIYFFSIYQKGVVIKKSILALLVSIQIVLFCLIPSQIHNRYIFNYDRYVIGKQQYNRALKAALFFQENKLLKSTDYIFTFQHLFAVFLFQNTTFPCYIVEFPKYHYLKPDEYPYKPKQLFNYDEFGKHLRDGIIKYLIFKKGETLPVFLGNTFSQYLPRYEVEDYIIYQWSGKL